MLGSEHYCDEGVSDLHESNDDEDPLKQPIDAVSVVEDNTIQKFLGSPVSPESSIGEEQDTWEVLGGVDGFLGAPRLQTME